MTLLALDMAFGNIGYTVWCDGRPIACGLITSEKRKNKKLRVADCDADQCASMSMELREIIDGQSCGGIVAEIPSGSQSAIAAKCNGLVIGLVSTLAAAIGKPIEFCTPDSVKKSTVGKKNASKMEIMDWVIGEFGGGKSVKEAKITKGKNKGKVQERITYTFLDTAFPKTKFEHVADSVGAYMASRSGNLVRMFG